MSWCDKLASRPLIGMSFNKRFRPSTELISGLAPVLDPLGGALSDGFSISKQDTFSVEVVTDNGFTYGVDPARLFVEFQHRLKFHPTSGGLPTVEMLSEAKPYSAMVPEVMRRLLDCAEALVEPSRVLNRAGIASTTMVSEDDFPPGIARFVEYSSRPWKGKATFYHLQLTAIVDETDEWQDRCIHVISKPETEESLVTLRFDYQRTFTTPKNFTTASALKPVLNSLNDCSLDYLERLAEGDMFDGTYD